MSGRTLGIVNLMPNKIEAEQQWDPLGVNLAVKFDQDPRTGGKSARYLDGCAPISEAIHNGLDGLVITGANLELNEDGDGLLPFEDIEYYEHLTDVMDWSRSNLRLTVYSCLASHIALSQLCEGDRREFSGQKTFGVYRHEVAANHADHPLLEGLGKTVRAPHSRWGNIPGKILEDYGIQVLAAHEDAGWLMAVRETDGRTEVFLQGHPEYGRWNLDAEYQRDRDNGQFRPDGYYRDNDPSKGPVFSWRSDQRSLFQNLHALAAVRV